MFMYVSLNHLKDFCNWSNDAINMLGESTPTDAELCLNALICGTTKPDGCGPRKLPDVIPDFVLFPILILSFSIFSISFSFFENKYFGI